MNIFAARVDTRLMDKFHWRGRGSRIDHNLGNPCAEKGMHTRCGRKHGLDTRFGPSRIATESKQIPNLLKVNGPPISKRDK